MKISVLIGSRDRLHLLCRCLRSVLQQDYDDFEVHVLDDGSTQRRDLCEKIRARFRDERLHCHRSEKALGVPGGRNALAQRAQGDVVCFIDDDAWFADQHALSRVSATFERYPRAGVLAFKVIDHRQGNRYLLTPFHRHTTLRYRPGLVECPQRVSHFVGGGHAIRRSAFLQSGGFDETLYYGGEERDLSYRLIEDGHAVRYAPSVCVLHRAPAAPLGAYQRSKAYYLIRNRIRVAYRYLPWWCLPVHIAAWVVRYGLEACLRKQIQEFARGVVEGMGALRTTRRTPMSEKAVSYLKAHHGQLWF